MRLLRRTLGNNLLAAVIVLLVAGLGFYASQRLAITSEDLLAASGVLPAGLIDDDDSPTTNADDVLIEASLAMALPIGLLLLLWTFGARGIISSRLRRAAVFQTGEKPPRSRPASNADGAEEPIGRHPNDPASVREISAQQSAMCRACGAPLELRLLDFGLQPGAFEDSQRRWPLQVSACDSCRLVQLGSRPPADGTGAMPAPLVTGRGFESTFDDAEVYALIARFNLTQRSRVIEVGSGDGALLGRFTRRGVPALGVEPDRPVAQIAIDNRIRTRVCAFDLFSARKLVKDGDAADLLIANDSLATASNLCDLTAALRVILKPEGVATLQVPYLPGIIDDMQFDAISHRHKVYFSLQTIQHVLAGRGLRVIHTDIPPTSPAVLRIFACRLESSHLQSPKVAELLARERDAGFDKIATHRAFAERVAATRSRLLTFFAETRKRHIKVIAYGGSPRASAFLNLCGIRADMLDCIVDDDPNYARLPLSGSYIPVSSPSRIDKMRPHIVLLLPGTTRDQVFRHCRHIQSWGGYLVRPD